MRASDGKGRAERDRRDEQTFLGVPVKRFIIVASLAYVMLILIGGFGAIVPGDEFQIDLSAFFNCTVISSLICLPFIVFAWRKR